MENKQAKQTLAARVIALGAIAATGASANALDVAGALTGSTASANIETGALWALGIVVVIYGARKVIGFFGR